MADESLSAALPSVEVAPFMSSTDEPLSPSRQRGDTRTPWWKRGVIYQIYPRSFQDERGDGVGDLMGIERRLDYVASLGVSAIWI